MKKRILAVILCFILVPGLLAGCNNWRQTASGEEKIVLDYWTLFGGGDAKFMEEIVAKFNKSHPNIQVNYIQFAFDDYYTKLVTGIAAGKSPDVAVAHSHRLPQLVKLGIVSSLDRLAKTENVKWNTFNQNILKITKFNNKHYAIPIDTHPIVFYYNKKHLKEAGLLNDQGKPIMEESPEGFVKFLTTLKEKLPEEVAPLSFPTGGTDAFRLWWSLYGQLGADGVLSDDVSSPDIDMNKAIKAANYLKDLYYKHEVVPLHISDFYGMFQSGDAATFISGVWTTGIWEGTKGLDFGVVPLPTIFKENAVLGSSHTLFLPEQDEMNEERRKAALTFANFVAENGQIWGKAGHIPAYKTVFEKEAYKELPHRSNYKEAADYALFPKRSASYGPIESIITRRLDTVLNGSTSAENAFKQVEKEIKEVLDNSLLDGE